MVLEQSIAPWWGEPASNDPVRGTNRGIDSCMSLIPNVFGVVRVSQYGILGQITPDVRVLFVADTGLTQECYEHTAKRMAYTTSWLEVGLTHDELACFAFHSLSSALSPVFPFARCSLGL